MSDIAAPITNQAGSECASEGVHTVSCRGGGELNLRVEGGNGGDVIDTRQFAGIADLTGGSGNDRLYIQPHAAGFTSLRGGPGHNLLVGNRLTVVSYQGISAPVLVDLEKGVGITRGERDRIVGVGNVTGGDGRNRLFGSRTPESLVSGGPGTNYLVARAPHAILFVPRTHAPSTFLCAHTTTVSPTPIDTPPSTYVGNAEAGDVVSGPCRVDFGIQLLLPLRSPNSPVFSVSNAMPASKATITAVRFGALVGAIDISPPASPANPSDIYCYLTSVGRRLLRAHGRLRVRIDIYPAPARPGEPPSSTITFQTTLARPRAGPR